MTIDYSKQLESGRQICIFYRLLKIWKGSLFKLIWLDLLIYLGIFYCINFTYRFALNKYQKKNFVKLVQLTDEMKENIPFFFLLGFFVAGVIVRWMKISLLIPYLNRQAMLFESSINGNKSHMALRLRRTLLRYLNLAWILLMHQISSRINFRFRPKILDVANTNRKVNVQNFLANLNNDPKIQNTYGIIITSAEIKTFESLSVMSHNSNYDLEYWIPIQWASRVIQKSFLHNYIGDVITRDDIIKELDNVRNDMHSLQLYCDIMIPLVYTQVVLIAIYSYYILELCAAQFIDPKENVTGHEVDTYFPIFTVFEFLFLMGWLKVAICVMNPFGKDEEDFETSNILDNNLDSTYQSVSGEAYMYAENFDLPEMEYSISSEIEGYDPDNLESFLDDIDCNIKSLCSNIDKDRMDFEDSEENYSRCSINCIKSKKINNNSLRKEIECHSSSSSHID